MDQADIKLVGAIEAHLEAKDARIAELEKFAREFLLYFTSSNGIPVERATIKADSDIVHMARALMDRGADNE